MCRGVGKGKQISSSESFNAMNHIFKYNSTTKSVSCSLSYKTPRGRGIWRFYKGFVMFEFYFNAWLESWYRVTSVPTTPPSTSNPLWGITRKEMGFVPLCKRVLRMLMHIQITSFLCMYLGSGVGYFNILIKFIS